jgi:hypothetical protein
MGQGAEHSLPVHGLLCVIQGQALGFRASKAALELADGRALLEVVQPIGAEVLRCHTLGPSGCHPLPCVTISTRLQFLARDRGDRCDTLHSKAFGAARQV